MTMTLTDTIPGYVAGTWAIDPEHSQVGFAVRHMMIGKARGTFTRFSGELVTTPDVLSSSVTAEIDLASVDTGSALRDANLRAHFFDVGNHPQMTYRSTGLRPADGHYVLDGELTLKGITKNMPLILKVNGFGPDTQGGTRASFTATGEINRQDFGVRWNAVMEAGGAAVSDNIAIYLQIEAVCHPGTSAPMAHSRIRSAETTKIRRMSPSDVDAVCEVIGQAFADNPNTLAMVRGDRAKAQRIMRGSARVAKFGRTCSYGLVAEQGDRIVGALNAAAWPSCQLRAGEKVRSVPALVRAMGMALPRALKLTSVWAKLDPKEPHWHIGPIGVVPEVQGQGVGKALLSSFLEMADQDGSMAYLETDVDRNVPLYEKFGFRVIAREEILGVNNRFMRRDAKPPVT